MRILYGIQGTGNGHITRARHMAKAFALHPDVKVDYFFSGRKPEHYFDMDIFNAYSHAQGLTFATQNGRIQHAKTIINNNVCRFIKDIRSTCLQQYDLVLNDFEPISAWAAKRQNIPSLSLSHQAVFLNRVPVQSQTPIDKLVTRYFAPTKYQLGTHWYHFGYNIVPPFVSEELVNHAQKQIKSNETSILVYLPFESTQVIQEQLSSLSEWDFTCFHPDVKADQKHKNIHWKKLSVTHFKKDLMNCSGVISNCGFELSTECLALGKPLLVKPLEKQYEQLSNAYTLEKLGLCDVISTIQTESVDDWLQIKESVNVKFPTDCDDLVRWIKQGNWQNSDQICQSLWQKVSFPNHVKDKLDKVFPANI